MYVHKSVLAVLCNLAITSASNSRVDYYVEVMIVLAVDTNKNLFDGNR